MAVLKREPFLTRDERRLDVSLGALDDVHLARTSVSDSSSSVTNDGSSHAPSTTSRS